MATVETLTALGNVSSTHVVEIPHPNPSPWGRGAKTLILRLLPLAQFGRGGWGVRGIKLTLGRDKPPVVALVVGRPEGRRLG